MQGIPGNIKEQSMLDFPTQDRALHDVNWQGMAWQRMIKNESRIVFGDALR